jgi:ABC-type transporter Mla subunit MlaD
MRAVRDSAGSTKELLGSFTDPEGDMQTTLKSLNRVSAQLEEKLPVLIDQTNQDLVLLQKTTAVIHDAAVKSAPKVPRMIDKTTRFSEGAGEVVDVWKTIWPWSARLKKPKETTIQSQSVD